MPFAKPDGGSKTNNPETVKTSRPTKAPGKSKPVKKTKTRYNDERPVIYQLLPRLFTNYVPNPVPNGSIKVNGSGKLNDITPRILDQIRALGATHVWYTGVVEHAHCTDYSDYGILRDNPHIVKGKAGSPYAIKDWYDIDPDIAVDVNARMTEFERLVERSHAAGLKVITDFVPNHVARQYHSDSAPIGVEDLGAHDDPDVFFSRDNNFYYIPRQQLIPSFDLGSGQDAYVEFPAKCTGNDCYTAYPGRDDWYETVKLNYGYDPGNGRRHFDPVPDTWLKMLHVMRFWASKGIDGLRCDMVHMVPVEFWQWAIPQVKKDYPHIIFIAEIYDVGLYRDYLYRGGFDYLYDKVTLYDTLRGIQCHGTSAAQLTSCWQTVEGIAPRMLSFLENHDEQRYASRQFEGDPSHIMAPLCAICAMNTGAVMIYMGQEIGEPAADAEGFSGRDGRTTIFDYWSLDTLRRWLNHGKADGADLTDDERRLRAAYSVMLNLVNDEEALRNGAFFDLTYANYLNNRFNPHRHFAFMRYTADHVVLVVLNFDSEDLNIDVNIPDHAFETIGIQRRKSADTIELITRTPHLISLDGQTPACVHVPAYGAVMHKFSKKGTTLI